MELIDTDGNVYLDGVSSLWCNVHGHGVDRLLGVLTKQSRKLCHSTLLGLSHAPIIELTERLVPLLPDNLSRLFYTDGGSVAVESAVRMAIEWWQKQEAPAAKKKVKLAALASGYHGDTLGSVGLGYVDVFHQHLASVLVPALKVAPPHVYRFYEGLNEEDALAKGLEDLQKLFAESSDELAAFVVEPLVQGAAGIWIQPPEYLNKLSRLCKEHDVFLVVDEIATGFGKTGKMFAVEHTKASPDILTMGKGLSAGYLPIAAAAVTEEVFSGFYGDPEELKTFFFGQTFSGNPLAASVSAENLSLFSENKLLEQVNDSIPYFADLLDTHIAPLAHVDEVRVCGLMVGIELTAIPGKRQAYAIQELAGQRVIVEARKRGLIIRPLGNVIILMPALAMTREQLERLVVLTAESIVVALGE